MPNYHGFTFAYRYSIISIIKAYYVTTGEEVMVNIKPSAAIRKNYNEISNLCKQTKEPVFLTKNGEGDLVVMDLETFAHREKMLQLREKLLQSDSDIQSGRVRSVEETVADMRLVITEAVNARV